MMNADLTSSVLLYLQQTSTPVSTKDLAAKFSVSKSDLNRKVLYKLEREKKIIKTQAVPPVWQFLSTTLTPSPSPSGESPSSSISAASGETSSSNTPASSSGEGPKASTSSEGFKMNTVQRLIDSQIQLVKDVQIYISELESLKEKTERNLNVENFKVDFSSLVKEKQQTVLLSILDTVFQCPICLNPLCEPEETPSGDLFCYDCIDTWLKDHETNPLTNAPLKREELKTAKWFWDFVIRCEQKNLI